MIQAVIFDFGNVISKTQDGSCHREMEKLTGIPFHIFQDAFFTYREPFDRGELSGSAMYASILRDAGHPELAKDSQLCDTIARLDLESWRETEEDVTQWALSLKREGYKLGILSNMPYEFLDLYEKDITLFVQADVAVFSCREKLVKPQREIYDCVLSRLHIAAEEAVFFDDMQVNVDVARSLGIHAYVWTGLERAKKDFRKHERTSSISYK